MATDISQIGFDSCPTGGQIMLPDNLTVTIPDTLQVNDTDLQPVCLTLTDDSTQSALMKLLMEADGTNTVMFFPEGDTDTIIDQTTIADWALGACCEFADGDTVAASVAGSITITGPATYTPSPDGGTFLESVTAFAFGGTVNIVDTFANASLLRDGQSKHWTAAESGLPVIPPTFTIPAGVQLDVVWTEPSI